MSRPVVGAAAETAFDEPPRAGGVAGHHPLFEPAPVGVASVVAARGSLGWRPEFLHVGTPYSPFRAVAGSREATQPDVPVDGHVVHAEVLGSFLQGHFFRLGHHSTLFSTKLFSPDGPKIEELGC